MEIMDATGDGMHQCATFLSIVVIDSMTLLFRSISFVQRHQTLFHIGAQPCHDMHPLVPQMSKSDCGDISLVGVRLPNTLSVSVSMTDSCRFIDIGGG